MSAEHYSDIKEHQSKNIQTHFFFKAVHFSAQTAIHGEFMFFCQQQRAETFVKTLLSLSLSHCHSWTQQQLIGSTWVYICIPHLVCCVTRDKVLPLVLTRVHAKTNLHELNLFIKTNFCLLKRDLGQKVLLLSAPSSCCPIGSSTGSPAASPLKTIGGFFHKKEEDQPDVASHKQKPLARSKTGTWVRSHRTSTSPCRWMVLSFHSYGSYKTQCSDVVFGPTDLV